jgi:hypothetical protein
MGFPIITVTEREDGVLIRQDRYLETGPAPEEHNKTIWTVPLAILATDTEGKPHVDHKAVLDTRERFFPLDVSRPFKLNAGTVGVCEF